MLGNSEFFRVKDRSIIKTIILGYIAQYGAKIAFLNTLTAIFYSQNVHGVISSKSPRQNVALHTSAPGTFRSFHTACAYFSA